MVDKIIYVDTSEPLDVTVPLKIVETKSLLPRVGDYVMLSSATYLVDQVIIDQERLTARIEVSLTDKNTLELP